MSTFDMSAAFDEGTAIPLAKPLLGVSDLTLDLLKPVMPIIHDVLGGGDVWRMGSPDLPAVPETLHAFGNKRALGIRAWVPFEDKNKLMAGTAAWANLNDDATNGGGWTLNALER
jgi:hypothetical protein